jgi:hypothetical protein
MTKLTKKLKKEIWDEGMNDDYIANEITDCALLCINELGVRDEDIDEAINIYADGIHGSNNPIPETCLTCNDTGKLSETENCLNCNGKDQSND